VSRVRRLLADDEVDPEVRSDGSIFLLGDEEFDRFTGQQAFDEMAPLLDIFILTEPIEGISRGYRARSSGARVSCVHPHTRTSRPGYFTANPV
jgi:hypothetical protein